MNPSDQSNPLPLKQALKNEITTPELSDKQLNALVNLAEGLAGVDTKPEKPGYARYAATLLAAACACLLIVIFLNWGSPAPIDTRREIALEVVENHLHLKPLDISTNSIPFLQKYFTQLDFAPISSEELAASKGITTNQLLGGRYCSIKGNTAAQLRYQRPDAVVTVYQTDYKPQLFGEIPNKAEGTQPYTTILKGLEVTMWVEHDLLIVTVENGP